MAFYVMNFPDPVPIPLLENYMYIYNDGNSFDVAFAGSGNYELATDGGNTISQSLPGSPSYSFTTPSNPVVISSSNITQLSFPTSASAVTDVGVSGNSNLTSLNLSNCSFINVDISGSNVSTLNPSTSGPYGTLTANNLTSTSLDISGNGYYLFSTMTFSSTTLTTLNIAGGTLLTSFDISGCPNLTSLNINYCSNDLSSGINISSNTYLTNLVAEYSNNLNTSHLDNILSTLVANGAVGGYCNLAGTPSSPTGGQNNTDRLTLVNSRGWTVIVN